MLTGGIQPTTVPIANLSSVALRAGQSLQGVVQGTRENPFLQIGGSRISLGQGAGLTPGQPVQAEVVQAGGSLQLRITPQAATAAPQGGGDLRAVLAGVLDSLGAAQRSDLAPGIVPPNLPNNADALRQVFSLFVNRGSLGSDLQFLAGLVSRAAGAGAISTQVAQDFTGLVAQFSATESRDIRQLLERLGQGGRIEARLAQALRGRGLDNALQVLQGSLRAQLSRLLADEGLRTWLRAQRQVNTFEQSAGRTLDRLAGESLQNTRAIEWPYVFMELPLPEDGGIRHGQVHFFDERRNKGKGFDAKNATIALDLSTTRLGDLWIRLRMHGGNCQCRFRTTSPEAAEAIREQRGELQNALAAVGYPDALVTADLWDGDRFREAAALLRGYSGIDMNA